MTEFTSRRIASLIGLAVVSSLPFGAVAQKHYDPGATDTEIKIGSIAPYSGPASSYGVVGKVQAAYFKMLNDQGGINGRKINFISYDDGYVPSKTVEQARKLVESDNVLFIMSSIGTPPNTAIRPYMNAKKVPMLFIGTGASKFGDAKAFPWTMGWAPTYRAEGRMFATYIQKAYPDKRIGILFQNDDFGKEFLTSIRETLGEKAAKQIVAEVSYELTAPTVDSQVAEIKASNAEIFINTGSPKAAAQAIKKAAELDWKPIQFISFTSSSVAGVLKPAGFANAQGIMSGAFYKDPTDPQWKNDAAMVQWQAFMDKYYPEGDKKDALNVYGYTMAKGVEQVLRQAGDNLTRENVMKQAANLDFEIGVSLPGIRIKTSARDYFPMEQFQMMRFRNETWELFGPVIDSNETQ